MNPQAHKKCNRILDQFRLLVSLLRCLLSPPDSPSMKPSLIPLAPSLSTSSFWGHVTTWLLITDFLTVQLFHLEGSDHSYQPQLPVTLHAPPLFQFSVYLSSVLP